MTESRVYPVIMLRRWYHYNKQTHGYRLPRPFDMPDCKNKLCLYSDTKEELENRIQNSNLLRFVQQFRIHGHRAAELDPLGLLPKEYFHFFYLKRYLPTKSAPIWPDRKRPV